MLFRVFLLAIPLAVFAAGPSSGIIQTTAGTSFVGDNGPAANAILSQPEGLAIDAGGNLYIADADDSRVRKVSPNGMIQTVAGTGLAGFSGDGGPGGMAQLNHPYGIALDSAGNLYIADLGNARVRKLSTDGRLTTVAGGGLQPPSAITAASKATEVQLNAPRNVAVDSTGALYISDFAANQIYRVSPGGAFTLVAGTGKAGFAGDSATPGTAQLSAPAGLAVDASGNLFFADSGNGRVRQIAQGLISTVFPIASPTGVAVNRAGAVYVAAANYFGTTARPVGAGVLARDVAIDAAGNLYLSGSNFVRKMAPDGTLKIVAGNGASRYYGGDGAPATSARLHNPASLTQDDLGNWYIADTDNHRIRKIDPSGLITTYAGTGSAGTSLGNSMAMQAQLDAPRAVALDSLRNLYVADTGNNRVCKITPSGAISVVIDKLNDPEAIALDSAGNLYIANTGGNQVLKLSTLGTLTPVTDLLSPSGLAVDASGALYISESVRVSKFPPNGPLTSVLEGLQAPKGLAMSPTGALLIAETGAHRIRMISAAGSSSILAGTGVAGFAGDGGPATAAQLNSPAGVAFDAAGNIWIADTANQRLRQFSLVAAPAPVAAPLAQVSVVNAASSTAGAVAPDEIVSIFGAGFDPATTQVQFDGLPASSFYASATQLNVLVPAGVKAGSTHLTISVQGAPAADLQVPVAAAAPALFSAGQGTGQAAALNEDGSANADGNPAARGSVISLFGTGWSAAEANVSATVGGYNAAVLYAGPAPGFPGLRQVNLSIPAGFLPPGDQPVVLTVGGATTQSSVTLAIR